MKTTTTYQERLKSFKEGELSGANLKWGHKIPSMAGMARSFYNFKPLAELKDRVECTACGEAFASWDKFRANPIERHAALSKECFVSALGTLSQSLSKGLPIEFQELASACLNSFVFSNALCDSSRELASQGFISMPLDDSRLCTVGCIACLCFPQDGYQNPRHARKCPVSKFIDSCREETIQSFVDNKCQFSGPANATIARPDIASSKQHATVQDNKKVTGEEKINVLAAQSSEMHGTSSEAVEMGAFTDFKNVEACKEMIESLLAAFQSRPEVSFQTGTEKCARLFEDAKTAIFGEISVNLAAYESGKIDELAVLELLEAVIIEGLEKSHARRVNLIYAETERVVTELIKETAS